MQKVFLLVLFTFVCATAGFAQTFSNGEFFAGYTHERVQTADNVSTFTQNSSNSNIQNLGSNGNTRFGTNGFNVEGTGYFTSTKNTIGITGDVSGTYRTERDTFNTSITGGNINGTFRNRLQFYNFLAGPQYKFRNNNRVEPFARVLFGVAHIRNNIDTATTTTTGTGSSSTTSTVSKNFRDTSTDFAMAIGGGVDVGVSDRLAVRLIQFDYNPVFQSNRTINNAVGNFNINGRRQDNLRFSFGIVFK